MTADVVKKFLAVINDVDFMSIDDAYVGELALKSGVDAFHDHMFFKMYVDELQCNLTNSYDVYHPVKTSRCTNLLGDSI